jgi:ribosome assembly protein 4
MATLVPPRSAKRQRLANAAADKAAAAMADAGQLGPAAETLVVQLRSAGADGVPLGPAISLPAATGQRELEMLVNQLRRQARAERRPRSGDADEDDDDADEDLPFAFHVALPEAPGAAATSAANMRLQISKSIADDVLNAAAAKRLGLSSEDTLSIVFEPQAVFRVRPVTRCTSTLSGEHAAVSRM